MNFCHWLVAALVLASPFAQAQHQSCKGRQFLPCVCLGSGAPCKCKFVAIWLQPGTDKIWGGSAGKDRTEAGVRAHADKRVATWGTWDPYYRKYEIACTQCVDKDSLSANLVKRIVALEFDHWAETAVKTILSQADINKTLKRLFGAEAGLMRPFEDHARNLGERAKDLSAIQKELDAQLLAQTSKLEELLDRAAQAHAQLQAKPLLGRGFVYDKALGVFGYGSVDKDGAKAGLWKGWHLSDGKLSALESGPFAFSGSFVKSRREGRWTLASRFPAMTLEGQFERDKAQGAWTIRDGAGQSISGAFESGAWKGEASTGKAASNVMEQFSVLFGEPASTSAKVVESRLKALDEHFARLRKELQDLHERSNASIVFRKVDVRRTLAENKAYGDPIEVNNKAWYVAAEAARRNGYRTSSRSVSPNAPSAGVLTINDAAESNVRALREKWNQSRRMWNEYVCGQYFGDEYWRLTLMHAELSDALNDIGFERRVLEGMTDDEKASASAKEEINAGRCSDCGGSGRCGDCNGTGSGPRIICTNCDLERKVWRVCEHCKGDNVNAPCTICRNSGKGNCGLCGDTPRQLKCPSCRGKGYKKIGDKKRDCSDCKGVGQYPCRTCTGACWLCKGSLRIVCPMCKHGETSRMCDKCNLDKSIETKCSRCSGARTCQSCHDKR